MPDQGGKMPDRGGQNRLYWKLYYVYFREKLYVFLRQFFFFVPEKAFLVKRV